MYGVVFPLYLMVLAAFVRICYNVYTGQALYKLSFTEVVAALAAACGILYFIIHLLCLHRKDELELVKREVNVLRERIEQYSHRVITLQLEGDERTRACELCRWAVDVGNDTIEKLERSADILVATVDVARLDGANRLAPLPPAPQP